MVEVKAVALISVAKAHEAVRGSRKEHFVAMNPDPFGSKPAGQVAANRGRHDTDNHEINSRADLECRKRKRYRSRARLTKVQNRHECQSSVTQLREHRRMAARQRGLGFYDGRCDESVNRFSRITQRTYSHLPQYWDVSWRATMLFSAANAP